MNQHGADQSTQSAMKQLEINKSIVIDFIKKAVELGDPIGAAEHVADHYVQHNPIIPNGKDGFIEYFKNLRQIFPTVRGEIKRIFAEGEFVVVHMHAIREPGDTGLAIVDIFRLMSTQIAEHWEVRQPVVQSALHDNGML